VAHALHSITSTAIKEAGFNPVVIKADLALFDKTKVVVLTREQFT